MRLIKDLGMRRAKKGYKIRWGLFLCQYCNEEVEKFYRNGLKQKSCGCTGY